MYWLMWYPSMSPWWACTDIGIRRRSFWIALGGLAIVSIPMAALWLDYLQAMRNVTISADYSVGSLPLILAPLIAWFLRSRPREATAVVG